MAQDTKEPCDLTTIIQLHRPARIDYRHPNRTVASIKKQLNAEELEVALLLSPDVGPGEAVVGAGETVVGAGEENSARFTFVEEMAGASTCFPITSVPATQTPGTALNLL